jgi:hypothetical protein
MGGMQPRRSVLAPELERWCERAGEDEQTTAIVRLGYGADSDRAGRRVSDLGMRVRSSGRTSVLGEATPGVLRRIAGEPWVLAVEAPQRLLPLAPKG